MKRNISSVDRIIRIVLAFVFFSLPFFVEGSAQLIAIVGFVPLITALVNFCPLYRLFGISTCKVEKKTT